MPNKIGFTPVASTVIRQLMREVVADGLEIMLDDAFEVRCSLGAKDQAKPQVKGCTFKVLAKELQAVVQVGLVEQAIARPRVPRFQFEDRDGGLRVGQDRVMQRSHDGCCRWIPKTEVVSQQHATAAVNHDREGGEPAKA